MTEPTAQPTTPASGSVVSSGGAVLASEVSDPATRGPISYGVIVSGRGRDE